MLEADEELLKLIDNLLDVFTVEEILEQADLSPATALFLLNQSGDLELPEVKPI
jgi:hypothetical protein